VTTTQRDALTHSLTPAAWWIDQAHRGGYSQDFTAQTVAIRTHSLITAAQDAIARALDRGQLYALSYWRCPACQHPLLISPFLRDTPLNELDTTTCDRCGCVWEEVSPASWKTDRVTYYHITTAVV
jgi:hypothetical protein